MDIARQELDEEVLAQMGERMGRMKSNDYREAA